MALLVKIYQDIAWPKSSIPRAYSSCRRDGALLGKEGIARNTEETSEAIGSVGKIAEIDKSQIGKRKYSRDHQVE
ncbi:hypothetical protein NPIL_700131, partial [Nephila pilipes]